MLLDLGRDEIFRLQGARGASILVLRGVVWITEHGRASDSFVGAGKSYPVRGDGLVLVSCETAGAGARIMVARAEGPSRAEPERVAAR
jgi:hypothetical protein